MCQINPTELWSLLLEIVDNLQLRSGSYWKTLSFNIQNISQLVFWIICSENAVYDSSMAAPFSTIATLFYQTESTFNLDLNVMGVMLS